MIAKAPWRRALLLPLLLAGCSSPAPEPAPQPSGGSPAPAPEPAQAPRETRIPPIDLEGMEPEAARVLGEARSTLLASPGSAQAWGKLGMACDAYELEECAQQAYSEVSRLAPGEYRWPYLLGIVRERQGAEVEELERLFGRAVELEPTYAAAYYRLGESLLRAGKREEARASYGKAIELEPGMAIAHLGKGRALLGLGRLEEALRSLEQARSIGPEDGGVYTTLAQVYGRLKRPEAAREAAEKAKGLPSVLALTDPVKLEVEALAPRLEARRAEADRLLAARDYVSAIPELRRLAVLQPDDPLVHYLLGHSLVATGQPALAVGPLLKAVELKPELHQASGALGDIAMAKAEAETEAAGRADWYQRAVGHYRQAVQAKPALAEYRARLGGALASLGLLAEAVREFETAQQLGELNAAGHTAWGLALAAAGDLRGGLEHLRRAVLLDPNSAAAETRLGSLLERLDDRAAAISHYRRAVQLDPKSPAAARLAELTRSEAPR